jgi:hypothetical protein
LLACGDGKSGSETLTIDYQLFRRGANVACGEATEVREIEVTLFGTNGITPRVGWPRKATCEDTFTASDVEPGSYVLQVAAIGELQGDPNAVLYRARTDLTVPSEGLSLSLQPEIAFLDLSWTFGDNMLAPCATEVASIDVLVSGGGDPYTGRFDCNATPLSIEEPFSLQSYAIQVIAYSAEGFPLFTADAQRTLDRGLNQYTAVLRPQGGQLKIDFAFLTGQVTTRFCDDPAVNATEIVARVENLQGGPPVSETFSCMEARPYAFKSARFTQGRELRLELIAEAAERYKGVQEIVMPAGDHDTGLMTMVPVGSATVAVRVESSTCAADVERFDVSVRLDGTPIELEQTIEPPSESSALIDLPYGTYTIEVQEIVGGEVECSVSGQRAISDRENDWEPFVL